MVYSKQDNFLSSYYPHQNWSLPDSIIYYISKNSSSPKCYQKKIKCCKYFFIKNPIINVESLYFDTRNDWMVSSNGEKKCINFSNFSCKFWITKELNIYAYELPSNAISSIISKLYQIDATTLRIKKQIISFKDFQFLSSNVEKITLYRTLIKNEDSSFVPFENLVQQLPKLKEIILFDNQEASIITRNTVKELLTIPHFSKMNEFRFYDIPESFDIETLFDYKTKQSNFILFYTTVSHAYKNRLKLIVDEILSTEMLDYHPPYIQTTGIPTEKARKLSAASHEYKKNFAAM